MIYDSLFLFFLQTAPCSALPRSAVHIRQSHRSLRSRCFLTHVGCAPLVRSSEPAQARFPPPGHAALQKKQNVPDSEISLRTSGTTGSSIQSRYHPDCRSQSSRSSVLQQVPGLLRGLRTSLRSGRLRETCSGRRLRICIHTGSHQPPALCSGRQNA